MNEPKMVHEIKLFSLILTWINLNPEKVVKM